MGMRRKARLGQLIEARWYELGEEKSGKEKGCVKGSETGDVQPRADTGAAGTYQLQETI